MTQRTPRDVLNKLKWTEGLDLNKAEVWYVHRGAPNDTKIISGSEISKLGRGFFYTKEATIPYHRIFKIVYEDKVIFESEKR